MLSNRMERLSRFKRSASDDLALSRGFFPLPDDRFQAMKRLELLRQHVVASVSEDMQSAGLRFAPLARRLRLRKIFAEIERQHRLIQQGYRLYMGGVFDKQADRVRIKRLAVIEDDDRGRHTYSEPDYTGDVMCLHDRRIYTNEQRLKMRLPDKAFVPV